MKQKSGRPALWLFTGVFLAAVGLAVWAGVKKIPPEAALAEKAMAALRNSEAVRYLPDRCRDADRTFEQVMNRWKKEMKKWIWLRRYESFRSDFSAVSHNCNEIRKELSIQIRNRTADLYALADELSSRVRTMDRFTLTINEGHVARKSLTRAELALAQGRIDIDTGRLDQSEQLLHQAELNLKNAGKSLARILNRYRSDKQVERWQLWIDETIAESRHRKRLAVVVSKIDRKLYVYKDGSLMKLFNVSLGRNGLSDKRHSGDNATPEGRYRISRKNPDSLFHKALLLNYPNEEDRLAFRKARASGQIPPRVGIGGLIEIHGGGVSFMTRGCIALENDDMDVLYSLLPQDTPVTIVGSIQNNRQLISLMEEITGDTD